MNSTTHGLCAAIVLLLMVSTMSGCTQKMYWRAEMVVARQCDGKGDYAKAEDGFRRALGRARDRLSGREISLTLYRLGTLYVHQGRLTEALKVFYESLLVEKTVTGPRSRETCIRLLALATLCGNLNNTTINGEIADELSEALDLFSGDEREFVVEFIKKYRTPAGAGQQVNKH